MAGEVAQSIRRALPLKFPNARILAAYLPASLETRESHRLFFFEAD
jgi:hypothetical protein